MTFANSGTLLIYLRVNSKVYVYLNGRQSLHCRPFLREVYNDRESFLGFHATFSAPNAALIPEDDNGDR